jgi:3-oxoacyl-ACP reductase-like protein
MARVKDVLQAYINSSGLIFEQEPETLPSMDAAAAADAAAAPAVAPPADAPPADPSDNPDAKTKTLTDLGYVEAVRDMLELLSINPQDMSENDLEIFSHKITPTNAMDIHKDLKDIITSYGSPNA